MSAQFRFRGHRRILWVSAVALGLALAGTSCAVPASPQSPEAMPEPSTSLGTPDALEPSLEEVAASFEIPAGLTDEELAEAFVDRTTRWWNYGALPGLSADDRLSDYGLGPFAKLVASEHSSAISEVFLTLDNTSEKDWNAAVNANVIEIFIQSELRGEAPYVRTMSLISLDAAGSPEEGFRVLRMTVEDTSTRSSDSINSRGPFEIEVLFVTVGDLTKVKSVDGN